MATWTQDDIDALKAAIRRGVRIVRFGTREVEYHSLKEMRDLLAEMVAQVNSSTGGRSRLAGFRSGA